MPPTLLIDAVRLVRPSCFTYPHIAAVRLYDGKVQTRQEVIQAIRYNRATYRTYTAAGLGAKVIVHRCPQCGSWDYITTEPDWTTENNLLKLPRF